MSIRVGQIKVVPDKGDLAGNGSHLMSVLGQLSSHRPDVVVTPECFLDGYISTDKAVEAEHMVRYAIDPATSEYAVAVAGWARSNRSWVIFGCTRINAGCVYNSALIYDRAGTLVGVYDKTHLQAHDHKYSPGTKLAVFDSDFGPFGVMICADRRWPETVRTLALRGGAGDFQSHVRHARRTEPGHDAHAVV